ncbi:MAG: nucleoside-diphosphate sugar epimerase/dehydratase [Alphaproteobacteria bacterium]
MALRIRRFGRAHLVYAHDIVMAGASYLLSLHLRVGDAMFYYSPVFLLQGTLLFMVVAACVFWWTGLYRGVWRYASLNDLMAITRAVTLTILVFLSLHFIATRLEDFPRSALIINWFVLMTLLGAPRFAYRVLKDRGFRFVLAREGRPRVPVLLLGSGDGAELFIREMRRDPSANYRVVGIVGEKETRVGRHIHGIEVLGGFGDVPEVVEALRARGDAPQRMIITSDRIEGTKVRDLLEAAEKLGIALSRLPRLTDFKSGTLEKLDIRPIDIEDLLGRPQTVLDRESMGALIAGRRVMVTGAGGTIGSELVRQISDFGPSHLTLLDNGEFQLYSIERELSERHPELPHTTVLADVRNRTRLDSVVAAQRPELVFHAAALKHLPLVEDNPQEGVLTNVVGTRNVADACERCGVRIMVLISTDKAVNPTNVMGATKRLAESYCQARDLAAAEAGRSRARPATRFLTVRFGNVLGSTGSVVPLFQHQLEKGGPLTVTHPEMTRYFMTVREAVELVLQASALGARDHSAEGGIFVLDMGEPVRILDLARQMIRLAGLRPETDVPVVITGLRPGEKLHETLFHDAEQARPTDVRGILLAAPRTADLAVLSRAIDELAEAAAQGRDEQTLALLSRFVPEYRRHAQAGAPVRKSVSAI